MNRNAFSKLTDPKLNQSFCKDTVNSIVDNGTFTKIRRKYITNFQTPDEAQQGEQRNQ